MRTATLIFVAVLTAAAWFRPLTAWSSPTAPARRADRRLSRTDPAAPIVLAGDGDPAAGERLDDGLPATGATAEIPPAEKDNDPDATQTQDQYAPDAETGADTTQDDQQADDPQTELPPRVYSLQDFVNQGIDESPLGIEVREDCSKLASNEKVCGLAVLDVRQGSPADRAGVKRYTALTHDLLDGASVAAALVFPPAIVAVAVIDDSGIGETFDLVIGVDGRRVRHILDFQDVTSEVRAGDTVYLTIVRAGKRIQLPVTIPAGAAYRY
jgi:PDZ domain